MGPLTSGKSGLMKYYNPERNIRLLDMYPESQRPLEEQFPRTVDSKSLLR